MLKLEQQREKVLQTQANNKKQQYHNRYNNKYKQDKQQAKSALNHESSSNYR